MTENQSQPSDFNLQGEKEEGEGVNQLGMGGHTIRADGEAARQKNIIYQKMLSQLGYCYSFEAGRPMNQKDNFGDDGYAEVFGQACETAWQQPSPLPSSLTSWPPSLVRRMTSSLRSSSAPAGC